MEADVTSNHRDEPRKMKNKIPWIVVPWIVVMSLTRGPVASGINSGAGFGYFENSGCLLVLEFFLFQQGCKCIGPDLITFLGGMTEIAHDVSGNRGVGLQGEFADTLEFARSRPPALDVR